MDTDLVYCWLMNPFRSAGSLPTLKDVQTALFEEALRRSRGNYTQAAKLVGVSYRTLYRKFPEGRRRGRDYQQIQRLLDQNGGNAERTSKMLGKERTNIITLIRRGKLTRSSTIEGK